MSLLAIVLLLLCASLARAGCEEDEESASAVARNVYSEEEMQSMFKHPWKVMYASDHENPYDVATNIRSVDDCGAANVLGKLFVFGGKDKFGATNQGRLFNPNSCVCSDDEFETCKTCPDDKKIIGLWENSVYHNYTGSYPNEREDHVIVSDDNNTKAYIYGGRKSIGESDLWSYDGISRTYSQLQGVPHNGRKDACGGIYNGSLYIIGGIDLITKEYQNDVWRYDISANMWEKVWDFESCTNAGQQCPPTREDAACIPSMTGKGIVMFGGSSVDGSNFDDTWIFQENTWVELNMAIRPPKSEDSVFVLASDHQEGILHGGIEQSRFLGGTWLLHMHENDLSKWTWSFVSAVHPAKKLKDHCGAYVSGYYYSFGGEIEKTQKSNALFVWNYSDDACPYDCTGHGTCDHHVCKCNETFTGPSCNERVIEPIYLAIPTLTGAIVGLCTLCVILLCIAFVFLYYSKRTARFLRPVNPWANIGCLVGCIIVCSGILLQIFFPKHLSESPEDIQLVRTICTSTAFLIPVGFGIGFGALLGKVKRVADILSLRNMVKIKRIRTTPISAIVTIIVFVETALVTHWITSDEFSGEWRQTGASTENEPVYVLQCRGEKISSSFLLVLLFNVSILLYGVYLSYRTRNDAFIADAKDVGSAMYILTVTCIPTIIVGVLVRKQPEVFIVMASIGVNIAVLGIITQCMYPPFRDKRVAGVSGQKTMPFNMTENSEVSVDTSTTMTGAYDGQCQEEIRGKISILEAKISNLRARLIPEEG